jgi:hypothetical protein
MITKGKTRRKKKFKGRIPDPGTSLYKSKKGQLMQSINFLRFPLFMPGRKGVKEFHFKDGKNQFHSLLGDDQVADITGPISSRKVKISDLPNEYDMRILYALLKNAKFDPAYGWQTKMIGGGTLLKELGVPRDFDQGDLNRIIKSLQRWYHLSLTYTQTFYHKDGQKFTSWGCRRIISDLEITRSIKSGAWHFIIGFNNRFMNENVFGFVVPVHYKTYMELISPFHKALYRWLAAVLYKRSHVTLSTRQLCDYLGIDKRSRLRESYELTQRLNDAINTLNEHYFEIGAYYGFKVKEENVAFWKGKGRPKSLFNHHS